MRQLLLALPIALLAVSAARAQLPAAPLPGAPGVGASPQRVDVNRLLEETSKGRARGRPQAQERPGAEALTTPTGVQRPLEGPRAEYRRYAKVLLLDGVLDEDRKELLFKRATELGIGRDEALETAQKVAQEQERTFDFFLTQVRALVHEDELSDEDRRFLEMRGRDMGLGSWETASLIELSLERHRLQTLYRSFVEAFLEDGILDATEERQLEKKRLELGLTEEEHEEIARKVREEKGELAIDLLAEIRERDRTLQQVEEDLELYGRSLFQAPPTSFAPAVGRPPPDIYVIGPGDTFQVSLWGRLEAEYQLVVDGEGKVQFPKVGPVWVAGLTYAEAKELLKRKAESITGVSATVGIAEIRPVRLFVVGEAESPGAVTLTPLATVINAVMAAGGPTPIGSLRTVLLRRAGKLVATVDLYQFLRTGEAEGNRPLEAGDVVVLPKAEVLVRLTGEVRRPAIYELKPGQGIRSLLEYAGGLSPDAYSGRVQVRRARDHQQRVVLDVTLSELKGGFPLQDGDAVHVFALKPEIENEVALFGHTFHPGTYAYREGMRVRDLVGNPASLKPEVDISYAVILRETGPDRAKTVLPFDLGRALEDSDPDHNLALQPRDEVYVFAKHRFRPPLRATATGEVRNPGLYRIEQGARVADLVRLAGGLTSEALLGRAEVLRYLPDHTRETLYVDLGRALQGDPNHNPELFDEDELVVHSVWDEQFKEVVLIEGEIKGALDERFRRGQSVQERFAEIVEQEGLEQDRAEAEGKTGEMSRPGPSRPAEVEIPEEEEEGEAVEIALTRGMTIRDLVFKAGGLTKDAYLPMAHLYRTDRITKKITIHTFHLGKALADDPGENLVLQDLDHVVVHSAFDFAPVRKVSVSGLVNRPGDYPYAENMRVLDLVLAAGGLAEDAYLGDAEIVRTEVVDGETAETRTISFSLERAMAGEPQANLPLGPYDKLFVKGIPDWKESRRIELAGEVRFPGVYYTAKGEKLSNVLRRAGGYTGQAYLRGAVFTRERARAQQQQRLEELRDRLHEAILRASSEEVLAALSPEDVAAQRQYLASQQQLLQKLERARATGRVVVNLLPIGELEGSEWDVAIEDGDTLTLPPVPQTVEVVGQVYNPTSLLWEPENRAVEHYLLKTGGPTPDAEKGEIYVVLADGTVVSSESAKAGNWWSRGGLMDYELYPGDTVLVPEKAVKISYIKEFKDISQILYQVALTAGVFLAVY